MGWVMYRCPCCQWEFIGGRWKQYLASTLICRCGGTFERLGGGAAIIVEDSTKVTIDGAIIRGSETGVRLSGSEATITGGYFETEVGIEMMNGSQVVASDIVHRAR